MGGSNGFIKWAHPLIEPLETKVPGHLWVDVSELLHGWNRTHRDLAVVLFKLNDRQDSAVLDSITKYIHDQVRMFKAGTKNITLVIEGETVKPRHSAAVSNRARALNKGVRDLYLSRYSRAIEVGTKGVSNWMGRPPQWFNHRLAERLRSKGWSVIHCADGFQTDEYILGHAGAGDSVLSSDRDFLAFARPNTIKDIVFFDRTLSRPCSLRVRLVLQRSGLSAKQLAQAYLVSGCDDASVNLKGIGWITALRLVKGKSISDVWTSLRENWNAQVPLLISDYEKVTHRRGRFIHRCSQRTLV
jgi:hypothetical protein